MDFSKAFGTVNKDIMLDKLDRLGFRGIIRDLFDSYLSDRRMYVEVNGCKSETKTLNIGLPQGSVSAPWLFNLYINDMHRSSDKLNFLHFADDTTIYLSGRDLTRLCEEVCMELCKVDDWLKANRLSLNIDKTFYMILTHKNYDETDINIRIQDVQLSRVTSKKFLGVTIDDRLSHGGHLSALYKQLSGVRGILYKLSSFLPPHVIKMLYYSLFHSRMVYGISVWGGGGVTNISRIRKVNSSTLNIFTDKLAPNSPHPLSFDDAYSLFCLAEFHRFSCAGGMEHFSSKINSLIPSHTHGTRHNFSRKYSTPLYSKTVSHHQFLFNAVKLWNKLPPHLTVIQDTQTFKSKLKSFLRNNNNFFI